VFCTSKPVLNSGERSIKYFPFFSVVSDTKGNQMILYECQVFACSAVIDSPLLRSGTVKPLGYLLCFSLFPAFRVHFYFKMIRI